MTEYPKLKKDALNAIVCILLMFLVGGCMMILVITQSNNGLAPQGVTNSSMDLSKPDTNSINLGLPLKTKKDETRTKHRKKAISDITSEQSESAATRHEEASD